MYLKVTGAIDSTLEAFSIFVGLTDISLKTVEWCVLSMFVLLMADAKILAAIGGTSIHLRILVLMV